MTVVLVVIGVALAIALAVLYNQLIARRQMANNGWADIDVQLKRRADLVPQLVSVVQGYAAHERQLFTDIAEKRTQALAAGDDPQLRGAAETDLTKPLGRLIALGEGYPELKASQNFLDLQNQLADTENKIAYARNYYNGAVEIYNIRAERFPAVLIAGPFGFTPAEFFGGQDGVRS